MPNDEASSVLNRKYVPYLSIGIACALLALYGIYAGFIGSEDTTKMASADDDVETHPSVPVSATDSSQESSFPPRQTYYPWFDDIDYDPTQLDKWSHVPNHAVFVELDRRYDRWLLNTPIEIHIPNTEHVFHAIVDRITPNGQASITIQASPAPNESSLSRFMLSYGPGHTLGYLSTRIGTWEINGDEEVAWIVSSKYLDRAKDYTVDDIVIRDFDRYANARHLHEHKDNE